MSTSKHYTVKPPSKKVLKKYWAQLEIAEDAFYQNVGMIEKRMAEETGIEDIEFFRSPDDGCYCGVGNGSRTMRLVQRR